MHIPQALSSVSEVLHRHRGYVYITGIVVSVAVLQRNGLQIYYMYCRRCLSFYRYTWIMHIPQALSSVSEILHRDRGYLYITGIVVSVVVLQRNGLQIY